MTAETSTAPSEGLSALARLLGRLAAQEHVKKQAEDSVHMQMEEKPCR
ncbi:hypothetical protein [Sphingomonas sp. C3-2]|nr:hypothetical protein [Sphingomonas sp. C3-2]WOK35449.1 hypothetical protein QYC26_10510 [Sphingomonas sp. C3-2]